jgi:hypothetical protein
MITMAGGARARSGPPPNPNSAKSLNNAGDWTTLPAEGRKGRAPKWPLPDPSDREIELWKLKWKTPQAIMWERQQLEFQVALYVRRLVEVEQPGAPTNLGSLVRQMGEDLGDSLPGMARNHWKIATDDVADRRQAKSKPRQSARERMRVVNG